MLTGTVDHPKGDSGSADQGELEAGTGLGEPDTGDGDGLGVADTDGVGERDGAGERLGRGLRDGLG